MFEWSYERADDKELSKIKEVMKQENGLFFEHIGEGNLLSDTHYNNDLVFGNPEEDDDNWHKQSSKFSCAVVCQEFVAEQILNRDFSEQDFSTFAKKQGWYDSNSGTSLYDVGNILETMGINVEKSENLTLNDLAQELEADGKIICAVNSSIMQNPLFSLIPGLSADHAVQVIGIDCSDPDEPKVILNDPNVENGKGRQVDAETFLKSWDTSNNFAAIARI